MSIAVYANSLLDREARKLDFEKLKTNSEVLPDPYSLKMDQWVNDVH